MIPTKHITTFLTFNPGLATFCDNSPLFNHDDFHWTLSEAASEMYRFCCNSAAIRIWRLFRFLFALTCKPFESSLFKWFQTVICAMFSSWAIKTVLTWRSDSMIFIIFIDIFLDHNTIHIFGRLDGLLAFTGKLHLSQFTLCWCASLTRT